MYIFFIYFSFQCADEQELHSWIAALEKAIQLALSDRTVKLYVSLILTSTIFHD